MDKVRHTGIVNGEERSRLERGQKLRDDEGLLEVGLDGSDLKGSVGGLGDGEG